MYTFRHFNLYVLISFIIFRLLKHLYFCRVFIVTIHDTMVIYNDAQSIIPLKHGERNLRLMYIDMSWYLALIKYYIINKIIYYIGRLLLNTTTTGSDHREL